jgi:hypothetical protein
LFTHKHIHTQAKTIRAKDLQLKNLRSILARRDGMIEAAEEATATTRARAAVLQQSLNGLMHIINAKAALADEETGAAHPVGPFRGPASSKVRFKGDILDLHAECINRGRLPLTGVQILYHATVVQNLLYNYSNSFKWDTRLEVLFTAADALGHSGVDLLAGRVRPPGRDRRPGSVAELVEHKCFNLMMPSGPTLRQTVKRLQQPGSRGTGCLSGGVDQIVHTAVEARKQLGLAASAVSPAATATAVAVVRAAGAAVVATAVTAPEVASAAVAAVVETVRWAEQVIRGHPRHTPLLAQNHEENVGALQAALNQLPRSRAAPPGTSTPVELANDTVAFLQRHCAGCPDALSQLTSVEPELLQAALRDAVSNVPGIGPICTGLTPGLLVAMWLAASQVKPRGITTEGLPFIQHASQQAELIGEYLHHQASPGRPAANMPLPPAVIQRLKFKFAGMCRLGWDATDLMRV